MTVTDVRKDPQAKTMTITTEFEAGIDAVWQLWADPRKLERWWGPPTYPATVLDHDLTPGGTVNYLMTGPEGDQPKGYWRILVVEAAKRLEFEDGFADDTGNPNLDLPVSKICVTFEDRSSGGTQMVIETTFPSTEAMEQMVAMGMAEGMREALGQADAILQESVTAS